MWKSPYLPRCGECRFGENEDAYGRAWCALLDKEVCCQHKCLLSSKNISARSAERILHYYQKYRRGGRFRFCNPYLVGIAIDYAIKNLRKDKHEQDEKCIDNLCVVTSLQ